ncbi:hypothetical protein BZA05DRAFT_400242 [Tricharina praecox]|uniref:uncharacterized protein n=1 Tax=Tricharina praecox TaxID=43433 RepID=UPI0022211DEF|nr:uncharacterized protein BZA05DRAFT_400242 [Tricharina praecox]KAI5850773.1 hypothetical protein BZA05DRAFT_400242 [Tricharina praecox]
MCYGKIGRASTHAWAWALATGPPLSFNPVLGIAWGARGDAVGTDAVGKWINYGMGLEPGGAGASKPLKVFSWWRGDVGTGWWLEVGGCWMVVGGWWMVAWFAMAIAMA